VTRTPFVLPPTNRGVALPGGQLLRAAADLGVGERAFRHSSRVECSTSSTLKGGVGLGALQVEEEG
jgi:hypothetical protein